MAGAIARPMPSDRNVRTPRKATYGESTASREMSSDATASEPMPAAIKGRGPNLGCRRAAIADPPMTPTAIGSIEIPAWSGR